MITNLSFGQITLEHSYSNPSSVSSDDVFFTFNSESGLNYYTFNSTTNTIQIYNETHTLTNTFTAPIPTGYHINHIVVTDKLFNNNNSFEFLMEIENFGNPSKVIIFGDNGTMIQEFDNRAMAKIYKNNTGNFKLVVKNIPANIIDIYSLPGTLSVNQQELLSNKLIAFPNPTNGTINITNKSSNSTNSILEVFNYNGQKVIEKNVSNKELINLDVSNLSNGTYIYKLNGETGKFIKK